ncbi:MAG: hypothetical protein ACI93R_002034 [Flavobacteriales bacterium]|jgi:uncharacterized protein (UPF0276 family)
MTKKLFGSGLGLRREIIEDLKKSPLTGVDFFEIAPENWMQLGGRYKKNLRHFTERFAFACHGLSLSIGSTEALDVELLRNIRRFLDEHEISLYTEHMSWCSDDGHLYDLLPIPCTEEAVHWVANRIKQAQDILGRQIGMENASYYLAPPGAEMKEEEFISAVVSEADCLLHLDVNNIYVNSQNFSYDPVKYLNALPLDRVCYIHVAGHYVEDDGIIVDTHGADVIDPVWALLDTAYQSIGKHAPDIPTCLERDFNFPAIPELLREVGQIRDLQAKNIIVDAKRRA